MGKRARDAYPLDAGAREDALIAACVAQAAREDADMMAWVAREDAWLADCVAENAQGTQPLSEMEAYLGERVAQIAERLANGETEAEIVAQAAEGLTGEAEREAVGMARVLVLRARAMPTNNA